MDFSARGEIFDDLKENPWFGSAFEVYSYNDLVAAGLRAPVKGEIKESRDSPARFYGAKNHPYVKFAADGNLLELRRIAAQQSAVILVAVGSYAPMHLGHISMMEAADRAVRAEGDIPLGAVFSLHCEDHVRAKILPDRPDAPISTDSRYIQARAVCPKSLTSGTPTFIDLWDARMPGGPRSFTDIMMRLSNTLLASEIRHVTPVAVFGSDNGISMRAFAIWGRAVCVIRPKHEDEADEYFAEPQMKKAIRERRVLLVEREDLSVISSSAIRDAARDRL